MIPFSKQRMNMDSAQRKSEVSLADVHGSVRISKQYGLFKRLLAFAGPAYLVSVGYMDRATGRRISKGVRASAMICSGLF